MKRLTQSEYNQNTIRTMGHPSYRYFSLLLSGSLILGIALPSTARNIPIQKTVAAPIQLPIGNDSDFIPNSIIRRIKRDVARRFNVPVSRLKIAETRERTWDGCFGLPKPMGACTMIAISGWQVIVTDSQRSWIYHTNKDGSSIALNSTASLTQRSQLLSSFLPDDVLSEEPVVFQTVETGGFAGRTVVTKLNEEGVITRQTIAPNIRSMPVVIKRLSEKELQAFIEQIQSQPLNHLNRIRYSPKQGADWITTQLSSYGVVVEFADIAPTQLPSTLQTVMQSWQKLVQA